MTFSTAVNSRIKDFVKELSLQFSIFFIVVKVNKVPKRKNHEADKPYEPTMHDRMAYETIYTRNNKFGYNIRVNHPEIIEFYKAFKKRIWREKRKKEQVV